MTRRVSSTSAAKASCSFMSPILTRPRDQPLDNSRDNEYIGLMSQRLKDEIRQTRPFLNLEEEVFLEIRRTAEMLVREMTEALRPTGLTGTQYNVLRILRGAGEPGLTCGQVGERMVTHDPDLTRLMDRLEKRGLIQRARDERDRRVVVTRITPEGLRLMKELDGTVAAAHKQALGHVGEKKLRALGELLGSVRARE